MASSHQSLLSSFIFFITLSFAQRPNNILQKGIVFSVTKDVSTNQYVTLLHQGTPLVPTKLVLDLGGPIPWLTCASRHVSSSYRSIHHGSLHCSRAKASPNTCFFSNVLPNTCSLTTVNTITGLATQGELGGDILAVHRADQLEEVNAIATVDSFLFSCAPSLLMNGLASGAMGMLGLGKSRTSLPSQLATALGLRRQFSVCLSPTTGVIISGDRSDAADSLMYTPLVSDLDDTYASDYYINVRAIKVNDKRLSLDHAISTMLSTTVPYTTMESTIYEAFTKSYIEVATSMNMTRVAPVAPFGVCFRSGRVDRTWAGPIGPVIDLVLQSEMVKWRIHGRNSMVEVSDDVMCLGFLDGGLSPRASIVLGGYQLEDNLLEFNLDTSMLGFSSSLLLKETTCSRFMMYL